MSAWEQRQVASDTGLSKHRVVVEAVRLADRDGVDGLSMRRLAGALGAGAMSLYHYVASKEELLDAMIDIVFEEIELPPEATDWQSVSSGGSSISSNTTSIMASSNSSLLAT